MILKGNPIGESARLYRNKEINSMKLLLIIFTLSACHSACCQYSNTEYFVYHHPGGLTVYIDQPSFNIDDSLGLIAGQVDTLYIRSSNPLPSFKLTAIKGLRLLNAQYPGASELINDLLDLPALESLTLLDENGDITLPQRFSELSIKHISLAIANVPANYDILFSMRSIRSLHMTPPFTDNELFFSGLTNLKDLKFLQLDVSKNFLPLLYESLHLLPGLEYLSFTSDGKVMLDQISSPRLMYLSIDAKTRFSSEIRSPQTSEVTFLSIRTINGKNLHQLLLLHPRIEKLRIAYLLISPSKLSCSEMSGIKEIRYVYARPVYRQQWKLCNARLLGLPLANDQYYRYSPFPK